MQHQHQIDLIQTRPLVLLPPPPCCRHQQHQKFEPKTALFQQDFPLFFFWSANLDSSTHFFSGVENFCHPDQRSGTRLSEDQDDQKPSCRGDQEEGYRNSKKSRYKTKTKIDLVLLRSIRKWIVGLDTNTKMTLVLATPTGPYQHVADDNNKLGDMMF